MDLNTLSESQLDLCQRAYDEGMKTKDPVVNYFVDCLSENDEPLPYDPELYEEEILAWERSGGVFLE
jgi:hypothetical protein